MSQPTRDELMEAATELGLAIRLVWNVRDTLLIDTAKEEELTQIANNLTTLRRRILTEIGFSQ